MRSLEVLSSSPTWSKLKWVEYIVPVICNDPETSFRGHDRWCNCEAKKAIRVFFICSLLFLRLPKVVYCWAEVCRGGLENEIYGCLLWTIKNGFVSSTMSFYFNSSEFLGILVWNRWMDRLTDRHTETDWLIDWLIETLIYFLILGKQNW